MSQPMKLTIGYLYADIMSMYGDTGNITCLVRRCAWRGIEATVRELPLGERFGPEEIDLFLIGGGADSHQQLIAQDLVDVKGESIRRAVDEGAAALCVCAGYQLFGHYYRPMHGDDLPGLGLFDAWTVHRGAELGVSVSTISEAKVLRGLGNLIVEWDPPRPTDLPLLIGFESHGGRTYLGPSAQPLGRVLLGTGNNGDGTEGVRYKHAVGTYLHGPCLPKNPHLADFLIRGALSRNYGAVELTDLDDNLEVQAHDAVIEHVRRIRGDELLRTHTR